MYTDIMIPFICRMKLLLWLPISIYICSPMIVISNRFVATSDNFFIHIFASQTLRNIIIIIIITTFKLKSRSDASVSSLYIDKLLFKEFASLACIIHSSITLCRVTFRCLIVWNFSAILPIFSKRSYV